MRRKLIQFLVILLLASSVLSFVKPALAANSDIIINEIMYNPASGVDGDEFVELYNTSASAVDISNWCFTNGIAVCFVSGTTVTAHGYILISPSISQTESTYAVTPAAIYTGKLDNGGEKLTLKDSASAVVDELTYDDVPPWPLSPDGTGPSLELKNAALNNSLAESWAASTPSPTPGAQNSVANLTPPTISLVQKPSINQTTSSTVIRASVENATSVELRFKVEFGIEQTTAMYDDGTHSDGGSGDGVYGAAIPGQSAGKIVRYKVVAEDNGVTASLPGSEDSINYYGYVVGDTATADIPILRWYMDPADFDDMTTNHTEDDQTFPAVVVYQDQFFDNALVRVKGQFTTRSAKKKFKFDLPAGYQLIGAPLTHPIKEFALQTNLVSMSDVHELLGWKSLAEAGFPSVQNFFVRVHKNNQATSSEFYGTYLLLETYDKNWRERNDYQTGALYKQANDKKTRTDEDDSDIQQLKNSVQTLQGNQLKQYLYDNLDVPNIINFRALSEITSHFDWNFNHNIYQYRDTEGTGRWSYLPWDVDLMYTPLYTANIYTGDPADFDPLPDESQYYSEQDRFIEQALFQFPEFREMYFRRLRTLYDTLNLGGKSLAWFDEALVDSGDSLSDDHQKWLADQISEVDTISQFNPTVVPQDYPFADRSNQPGHGAVLTPSEARTVFAYSMQKQTQFVSAALANNQFAQKEGVNPKIVINEINYNPVAGQNAEYIELFNPNSYAVDISGWYFEGVDLTIPSGSVISAGSYGLVVKNDSNFRSVYGSGKYVIAQYKGALANEGEAITLKRQNGTVAAAVGYENSGAWPEAANGGTSLALIRTSADESLAACWAASSLDTPGLENQPEVDWVNQHSAKCTNRIENIEMQSTITAIPSLSSILSKFGTANGVLQENVIKKEYIPTELSPEVYEHDQTDVLKTNQNTSHSKALFGTLLISIVLLMLFLSRRKSLKKA